MSTGKIVIWDGALWFRSVIKTIMTDSTGKRLWGGFLIGIGKNSQEIVFEHSTGISKNSGEIVFHIYTDIYSLQKYVFSDRVDWMLKYNFPGILADSYYFQQKCWTTDAHRTTSLLESWWLLFPNGQVVKEVVSNTTTL